jgi:hypothetical protein
MSIVFDLKVERPSAIMPGHTESPYICRVEIEDDRSKLWVAELRDWWVPESGSPPFGSGKARRAFSTTIRRLGQFIRSTWSGKRALLRRAA